jgi:putative membrane protein
MLRTALLSLVRGFTMGAADIVPGVSGGTIALIFGIYERLIASVRAGSSALGHLVSGDLPGTRTWLARIEWVFILPLGGGILLAIALLSGALETLLIEQAVLMAALFVGLVAGSIVVTWQMLPAINARLLLIMTGVAVALFVLLGLRGGTTEDTVTQISDPALWAFFVAGAIAICAMILPGISGSFLLILLGMYGPVLGAVNERDFLALGILVLGTIIGLALFSQLLHRALSNHHDDVIAALIGLMVGSMRVLWPWPLGVDSTVLGSPDAQIIESIGIAIVAFVLVIVIARFAQRLERAEVASSQAT